MSIRIPSSPVLDYSSTIATATTDNKTFLLPQDCDGFAVKLTCSVFGLTTDDVYIQTTDDGGTTWYDMANMKQIITTITDANAIWAYFSVIAPKEGMRPSLVGSVGQIAPATAAGTSPGNYTGVPVLGRLNRIFFNATGTGASTVRVRVYANSQAHT